MGCVGSIIILDSFLKIFPGVSSLDPSSFASFKVSFLAGLYSGFMYSLFTGVITGLIVGLVVWWLQKYNEKRVLSTQFSKDLEHFLTELKIALNGNSINTVYIDSAIKSFPYADIIANLLEKSAASTWQKYIKGPNGFFKSIDEFNTIYKKFKYTADDFDRELKRCIRLYNSQNERHYVNDEPAIRYCLGRISDGRREDVLREYRSHVDGTDDWVEDAFISVKAQELLNAKANQFLQSRSQLKALLEEIKQSFFEST